MADSTVWVPVLASMKGFIASVNQGAGQAASSAGRQLEKGLGDAGRRGGESAASQLASAVEAATKKVVAARHQEASAAGALGTAEQELSNIRARGDASASQIMAAEAKVENARRAQEVMAARLQAAETDLGAVREGESARSSTVVATEKRLEDARLREAKAADTARVAAAALDEAKERSVSASSRLEAAEADLEAVRSRGDATAKEIKSAEAEVNRARRESDGASTAAAKAEGKLRTARSDAESATDQLRAADLRHKAALDDVAQASRQAEGATDDLTGSMGDLQGGMGSVRDLAMKGGGLLAGAGIAVGTSEVLGSVDAINRMNNQLGMTGDVAGVMGDQVSTVMRSGLAGSAEEAAGAVGALHSQFAYLGFEGERTAEDLSRNFLAFSQTFGTDINDAVMMAGSLVENDLAGSVTEAADLMTRAMQRVPAAMRDELPEIMGEYGTNFRALGFEGDEAFGVLVAAADKGKWALDKTGDALKEFTIRGSDMSKTSTDAYEAIGLSAEEMSSKIAAGGDGARDALQQVAQGIQGIEDPATRANTAIALFGTPLEDLSVDQIPQFLDALSQGAGEMSGFAGASDELADSVGSGLSARMNALKGVLVDVATNAFMWLWDIVEQKVIPAMQSLGDWAKRNSEWLGPLAAAVGGAAAAWAIWTGAVKAWQIITKIATGVQAAFNAVMAMNPIMLVVMAVAALAAGLVWFFTKTETGRELWSKFTDALGAGWDWVVDKLSAGWDWVSQNVLTPLGDAFEWLWTAVLQPVFGWITAGWDALSTGIQWAWDNLIKPAWDAISLAARVLFAVVSTVLITPFQIAWNLLSTAVKWAWENVIKPAWDALQLAAQWMWNNVLMPVWDAIKAGWDALSAAIQWAWENIVKPAWDALQLAAQWMWTNVLMPVWDAIKQGWQLLSDAVKWAWENIIKVAWDALQTAAQWMWDNVLSPVFGFIQDGWDRMARGLENIWNNIIKPVWDALGDAIKWVWENVVSPVFESLKDGVDLVARAFQTAVDAITKIWDGLKAAAAKPVKWVIDTVYNDGIRAVWNKVAKFAGLDELDEWRPGWVDGYATGGVLPGYTPGKDVHMFTSPTGGALALSGGEAIMRPEWTRAVGGPQAVERMNAAAKSGRLTTAAAAENRANRYADGGVVQRFAGGGIVEAMTAIVQQKYPGITMTSGLRNSSDYHGQGMAADFSDGVQTPAEFSLATDIADTYPGSLELIHDAPGWSRNIKNGAEVGPFGQFYTWDQAGDHTNHVHWAMDTPPTMPFGGGVFEGGSSSAGGSSTGTAGRIFNAAWNTIMKPILGAIPELPGLVGKWPKAIATKVSDSVRDFLSSKMPGGGSSDGGNVPYDGSGVEQWRPLVEKVLGIKGQSLALADTVLRRMNQESGGDPNAINDWDSNAQAGWPTKGLMQMRDDTFVSNADPGFNTNIWDPESNLRSSMNYAMRTYGSLSAAYDRAGGYDAGGVASGTGVLLKNTVSPERVLSPSQTKAFEELVAMLPQLLGPAASGLTSGVVSAGGTALGAALGTVMPAAAPVIAAATPILSSVLGQAVGSGVTGLSGALLGDGSGDLTGSAAAGESFETTDWLGKAADVGSEMIGGQLSDALGVVGVPDTIPSWMVAAEQIAAGGDAQSSGGDTTISGRIGEVATQGVRGLGSDGQDGASDGADPTATGGGNVTYQVVVATAADAVETVKKFQAREYAGFGVTR